MKGTDKELEELVFIGIVVFRHHVGFITFLFYTILANASWKIKGTIYNIIKSNIIKYWKEVCMFK